MIVVSVMYPANSSGKFDRDYYLQKHMPLVRERWSGMGMQKVQILQGAGTPDGADPPYRVITLLSFGSMQEFQEAAGAHAGELFADIPNFTDTQPIIQISEEIG